MAVPQPQVAHPATTFRYVPVLRHRQEEWAALRSVGLSNKFLPLVEIVKELPRSNARGTFQTIYTRDLSSLNHPVIVDFPTYVQMVPATKAEVRRFLQPLQANLQLRTQLFQQLSGVTALIPTVTYNPQIPYVQGTVAQLAGALRPTFARLAFRLFFTGFVQALADVTNVAQPGDIILLDIDDLPQASPALAGLYQQLTAFAQQRGCRSALVRAAINDTVRNTSFVDDQPIPAADNSLLSSYAQYGFDAFGDYAGIKKDLLRDGGTISPGFAFYSWQGNVYVGYKGRLPRLVEFNVHITPSVLGSAYYRRFTGMHHQQCPGCTTIQNIRAGTESGQNQGKWKRIAMMHYLYTMEEFL